MATAYYDMVCTGATLPPILDIAYVAFHILGIPTNFRTRTCVGMRQAVRFLPLLEDQHTNQLDLSFLAANAGFVNLASTPLIPSIAMQPSRSVMKNYSTLSSKQVIVIQSFHLIPLRRIVLDE